MFPVETNASRHIRVFRSIRAGSERGLPGVYISNMPNVLAVFVSSRPLNGVHAWKALV